MQSSEHRPNRVRAPILVAIIVALHGVAVGTFLFLQGCGTTSSKPMAVEPPPAPMMPPSGQASGSAVAQNPSLQPPVASQPATAITEPSASQTYVVQKGDSLSKIAARSGVSSREIAELNNIKDPSKIRIGQKLLMPSYASTSGGAADAKSAKPAAAKTSETHKAAKSASPAVAGPGEYVVKSGDSLSKIASRNGTTTKALREVNNLKSDSLKVGQKLALPAGSPKAAAAAPSAPAPAPAAPASEPAQGAPAVPAPPAVVDQGAAAAAAVAAAPAAAPAPAAGTDVPFEYQIKPGETLDDVARNFAVLKQDILALNGITDEASVKPGSKVKIPLSAP